MQSFDKRYWPHQFRMVPESDAWEQACRLEAYCIDNFKRSTWRSNGLYFAFQNQVDATLFLLKWG